MTLLIGTLFITYQKRRVLGYPKFLTRALSLLFSMIMLPIIEI